MADLYLLKYNNLYNKIIKKENTLSAYQKYQIGQTVQNVNFNPNDGVDTEQVINWEYGIPDYVVVGEGGNTIISRWFVVEATRLLTKQFRMVLRRDLIADNYDAVRKSTCFIEKGWVQNSNPLIFNNENMGFNQIKRGETLLKNNLGTPWLVLYLARYNNEGEYNSFSGSFKELGEIITDYSVDNLSEYQYYYWRSGQTYRYLPNNSGLQFAIRFVNTQTDSGYSTLLFKENGYEIIESPEGERLASYPTYNGNPSFSQSGVAEQWKYLCYLYETLKQTQNGLPVNTLSELGTQAGYNTLLSEQGKTIAIGETDIRRITAQTGPASVDILPYPIPAKGSELYNEMLLSMVTEPGMIYNDSTVDIQPQLRFPHNGYRYIYLSYPATTSESLTYDFNYTDGAVTTDSVYEIIATPYNDIDFTINSVTFNHHGNIAARWFQDIINKYNAAGFAYDLQLVPYCPVDVTNISTQALIYAQEATTNVAVAIKLRNASFSLQYDLDINFNSNPKISNETELFRFVSPNGISEYEFSPAKNNGLTGYEVDCTLIPFNPYIKINPIFSGLYGDDFNDYRGLICGGDFSMPILSNEWQTYQLSNKYYQDIFNRKIQSQEYNNKWQLASNITGAVAGIGAGAAAGAMMGGPWGAIAGGVLSAAGGALDVVAGQAMFREGIQAQRDLFGYELGTIKARSETLTRTTAYNINNKYFPYIEYYSCTDEEITALKNKIKYNGMSIGVIGKLEDYLNPTETSYIQGDLIEIDIQEEYHAVSEIANILKRGVRFYVD